MQAISREALPLPATPKGVTPYGQRKWLLFMLKGPSLKINVIAYLRVPTVRNGQCKQFFGGFTPASNPERGNNTWATKWAFIYVKGPRLERVSYRTLGFGSQSKEWPMQAISREAIPLPATPKGITTYVQRNGLLFML